MPPFVHLATILSGSQHLLESGGSKSIATINSGRQRTPKTPAERVWLVDFDLVVCADGYRSMGRGLIDPGATPCYRGMVSWRGLLRESDIGVDALDGCDLLRVG